MKSREISINGFWKAVKVGFKSQFLIAYALVFTTIVGTQIHHPIMTIILLVTPFMFGPLFIFFTVNPLVSSAIRLELLRRKAVPFGVPDEVRTLMKELKIDKRIQIKVIPDLFNVFARGNTIYLGRKILETLKVKEVQSVLAHELDHVKRFKRISLIRALSSLPVIFVSISLSNSTIVVLPLIGAEFIGLVCTITVQLAILAFGLIVLIPSNWYFEKKADETGGNAMGEQTMIDALKALSGKVNPNEHSFSHPSINSRIRELESRMRRNREMNAKT